MQQAGATPAEALALTLCTAIQFTEDCIDRGMDPNQFLRRFTFFFDISISFFEEIAKFRAGRRIWSRIVRERFGVTDPKAWRFKFHSQTSGVDLTRQQPLNNIARVAIQALAGVFGGTQSMHTDAYDEALTTPTEAASRIAINTQNIIRDEAHLDKVIDPLAGSYYVETLTNEMETLVEEIIARIDAVGGMYHAVESGVVQTMIGESALAFQNRVENGEQTIVGVNAYCTDQEDQSRPAANRCDATVMAAQIDKHRQFKARRDQGAVESALATMTDACRDRQSNVFEQVVAAAAVGVTHEEICHCLREALGFGQPLVVV
jgi:methylmalonyl-CoA mutase N-terminal domain/subunit